MPTADEITAVLERTRSYLTDTLLPFWMDRSPDRTAGGFLTYFDREGRATGQSDKTFLMQIRMLYTMASAHRAGYGGGRCEDLARGGRGRIGTLQNVSAAMPFLPTRSFFWVQDISLR